MDRDVTGPSIAELARRIAVEVRDDHAGGKRCAECTDKGCRRIDAWSGTIAAAGDQLDTPIDLP